MEILATINVNNLEVAHKCREPLFVGTLSVIYKLVSERIKGENLTGKKRVLLAAHIKAYDFPLSC